MVAIAQDAAATEEEVETEQQTTPENNPRYDQAEEIAERRAKEMEEALVQGGFIAPATEPEPAPQAPEKNTDPYLLTEEDLGRMTAKVKIDGKESVVHVADVLRTHQKDAAATNRLREANERLAAIEAREAAQALKEAEFAITLKPELSLDVDALAEKLTDSVFTGDREGTEEVFKALLAGRSAQAAPIQPRVDVASITQQVKSEISNDLAMKAFKDEFKDIIADPQLSLVADTYLDGFIKDGVSFGDALMSAGNETRAWLKKFAPAPSADPVIQTDAKVLLKRNLDNPKAAQKVHGHESMAPDNEETRSQTIAAMKAEREGNLSRSK